VNGDSESVLQTAIWSANSKPLHMLAEMPLQSALLIPETSIRHEKGLIELLKELGQGRHARLLGFKLEIQIIEGLEKQYIFILIFALLIYIDMYMIYSR
jgi:hypothetical protein